MSDASEPIKITERAAFLADLASKIIEALNRHNGDRSSHRLSSRMA